MTDPRADTIRQALEGAYQGFNPPGTLEDASRALDGLLADAAEARAERDDARANAAVQATLAAQGLNREMRQRAEAAEARVAALENVITDETIERAKREPLGVDISDYSDEWCDGFLAGQGSALEEICRALRDAALAAPAPAEPDDTVEEYAGQGYFAGLDERHSDTTPAEVAPFTVRDAELLAAHIDRPDIDPATGYGKREAI